jgi:hypothetical protein
MDKSVVESQLSLIEAQLAFLRQASLTDDPAQLPPALAELQSMLIVLSQTLRATKVALLHDLSVQDRLKKSFAMLSALREGMIRRGVGVDRALSALVPAAQAITYGSTSNALRHTPYGMPARQSGEFKTVSA